ncbi:MAG: ATP-binding cassette domain-containing protein [Gammaproteobacteria bacterium]|nr:ATP-binding cassette domain-containing protein [Gammaproteobacteria bacterium]
MSNSILELNNVRISLGGKQLLEVNCRVGPGEILTVMGPSGSGKSSLLAYIAGFLAPVFKSSGSVLVNGENICSLAAERRRVGLLFQDPLLFPHLSVAGNLRFAMPRNAQQKSHAISEGLDDIGLAGFDDRDPGTLSGGQASRVALLRLLLSAPNAVLLDEPFSKLDTQLREEIRTLVFDKLRASGLPTILVTHDQADAESAGGAIHTLR